MAINISVKYYNGGLLPDIILLTQSMLCILPSSGNPSKCHEEVCICNLRPHLLNVLTFFPLDWGMFRRSRRALVFL